ncbi:AMP-binding protein [Candidatus Sulfidibacterium hydrothermale]|uniref:AMP-dependent synthetase/ligase n=1 Tax=Candidatus Sulfidibacterium hydrothermale TaxID=2875962 RepID=UPI001F0A9837|nr:AMP-binding protein [Candidatus Sulfidibacterium hydrothermale]UBM63507.1 AMP-binding protein [Candidatus Sulfidibacterium hydrothermale]
MTIPFLFEESVKKYPDNVLVWEKENGEYKGITFRQIQEQVYHLAAGLSAIGVEKGDRVAMLSEGRSEWLVAELAILYLGAVNIPLSVKINEPKELSFRIKHAECRWVICSERQADKVRNIRDDIPKAQTFIVIGRANTLSGNEKSYQDVYDNGKKIFPEWRAELETRWKSIQPGDLANISYTSGTTADPKGIMLTHRNYTANVEQANSLMTVTEDFVTLLILPWDHSFAHTVGLYTLIRQGASMAVVELGKTPMETLRNIPKNIKEIKPTFLLSVPALSKNFRKNIEAGIRAKGKVTEKLFQQAMKVAYTYNGIGWDKGKGWRKVLKPLVQLYDKILFSKIREGFGGRLRFFIGGGALLDIDLQRFFYAIGIPVYQGYGLSEASPVISSNSPDKHKLGSSGYLVKNLELKICDDNGKELPVGEKGEIVIRGENVMKGYWKNETATAETIKEGWLHTGDMGYMDKDGFLYVLGRFKSLLIGNDGEKYSPEGIEEALVEQSRYIEQCMLYNNQNAYTIGLIYPNMPALKAALKELDLTRENADYDKIMLELIKTDIDQFLPGGKYENMFPGRWLPAAVGIMDEPFTEENRMLNSTMKMVRNRVVEHYKDLIDYLYSPAGKNILNERNMAAIQKLFGNKSD